MKHAHSGERRRRTLDQQIEGLPLLAPGTEPPSEEEYFDGETYDHERDASALSAQLRKVRELMLDGHWRTLDEISRIVSAPPASVSARLRDLRKPRFGKFTVGRRIRTGRLYEYQLGRGDA